MARLSLQEKLGILADAARYDASCASSGTTRRDSRDGTGLGSTEGSGICHAYAPDGRCISLLKILMTNFCIYDCAYCVNRVSSNVRRARFSARGGGDADAGILPPQLHRGAVPLLRHRPQPGRDDGGDGAHRPLAARGARLSRLSAPQDDPRRRPAAARRGGTLRRPLVDQCRAADGCQRQGARPRKGPRLDPRPRWDGPAPCARPRASAATAASARHGSRPPGSRPR